MNWMNILKRKVDTYEEYKKERKRLYDEMRRGQKGLINSLKDETGKRVRAFNDQDYEKLTIINKPLDDFDDMNEEYYDRMIRDEKFAKENEKRIERERERKAQMQSIQRGKHGKKRGARRQFGGRKGKKKKKGQFEVQRGSGQSKSERRSGGRHDSRQHKKL